jgi:hypothetical protein
MAPYYITLHGLQRIDYVLHDQQIENALPPTPSQAMSFGVTRNCCKFNTFVTKSSNLNTQSTMKRVIIGALVGTVIFFGFQTTMWVGGFHSDFYSYAARQDTILAVLSQNLPEEGMYMMPMADQDSPDFKVRQQELENQMIGNPWAMVFYHPKMTEFSVFTMLKGVLFSFISAFIIAFIMFQGKFHGFWSRFTVSMLFVVFTLFQGVLGNMNWWEFPWSFIKPQVIDLVAGWGMCSVWLGWFVRPKE